MFWDEIVKKNIIHSHDCQRLQTLKESGNEEGELTERRTVCVDSVHLS